MMGVLGPAWAWGGRPHPHLALAIVGRRLGAVIPGRLGRNVRLRRLVLILVVAIDRLELQAELGGRIGEAGDGRQRHHQFLGLAGKRQGDAEGVFVHRQPPELMLQHDGHFLGVTGQDMGGHLYSGETGAEGDVEMVIAQQAVADGDFQGLADHPAQGVFHHLVVAQRILDHDPPGLRRGARWRPHHRKTGTPLTERKWGEFCCPVPPGPRLRVKPQRQEQRCRWHL